MLRGPGLALEWTIGDLGGKHRTAARTRCCRPRFSCSPSPQPRQPREAGTLPGDTDVKYEEARTRLASHSNLPGTDIPESGSFVFSLWNANRTSVFPDISLLADDVINCLKDVNCELNGPAPSQSLGAWRNVSVISEIAYSVSGIIARGLQYHRLWSQAGKFSSADRELLEDTLCRIAYAWDQVLAGDTDNIHEGFDSS